MGSTAEDSLYCTPGFATRATFVALCCDAVFTMHSRSWRGGSRDATDGLARIAMLVEQVV